MFSISYTVYLFVIATALAFLEIQIEGPYGWAEKLPCWRPRPNSLFAKGYARVMGDRPLTGYHIAIFTLVLIVLHLPFFTGIPWALVKELEIFSAYFLLVTCMDFLWFVWNPHYGLKRFNKKNIWWHKNWIGPIPRDYPSGVGISLVSAVIAIPFGGMEVLVNWGVVLGVFAGLTLLSCLISHWMRKGRA